MSKILHFGYKVFSRVLRDSTLRFVHPLVGWLVDPLFSCGDAALKEALSVGPLVREHESKSGKMSVFSCGHATL